MVFHRRHLIICLILAFVHSTVVYGFDPLAEFCKQQQEEFERCSDRMEHAFIAHGMSVEKLCSEMSNYLTCVHETNMSCPNWPLFKDDIYLDAMQNSRSKFERYCHDYEQLTTCSQTFVDRLVSKCTSLLNKAQPYSTREEMCQYSKEYLACLHGATTLCHNDLEFMTHNVPLAATRTESAMKAYCDDMQGDAPSSWAGGEHDVSHPMCSQQNINTAVKQCVLHLEQPPEVTDVKGCRHQRMFVECMDLLFLNCPDAGQDYAEMMRQAEDTLNTLCTVLKCPEEVENESEDVVSYCIKNFYHVEHTDPDYCRKLSHIPSCVLRTRDLCPPNPYPYHVDDALDMLHDLLQENCGAEWTE